jgi:hypothetical protein
MHARRLAKYGTTDTAPLQRLVGATVAERLAARSLETANGCIEWQGNRIYSGYGMVYDSALQRNVLAHRAAYREFVGPIPEGMHVLHSCDNPPCVNIDHLRLGTPQENMKDRSDRGRHWAQRR